jgi:hypothetical protein
MIKNTNHCLICEDKKMDFTIGVYCGITDEKPKFEKKCPSKGFGKTLNEKIVEIDSNLKLIENEKSITYLHLYTFLSFAAIVLIADCFFINYLWGISSLNNSYYISNYYMVAVPIIIASVGLGLIPYAVAPLNKFKSQRKITNNAKSELDTILNLYNIQYEIQTKLFKGSHGIIDIDNTLVMITNNNKGNSIEFSKANAKLTIDY